MTAYSFDALDFECGAGRLLWEASGRVPAGEVERPLSVQTLCPWAVVGGPP